MLLREINSSLASDHTHSGYVPYSGASQGVDLGSQNLTTSGDITADNLNISNWNTAYGWGDHSLEGYLTDITNESIGDLSDVNDAGKDTDKVLKYNAVSGDWEIGDDNNTTYSASDFNHDDLSNISGGGVGEYNHITDAELTVLQNTSGTNTGDQTSIVGITGTKAQFDTACTDGDFAYSGGAFHDGFSDFVANEHIDWTGASDNFYTTGTLRVDNYASFGPDGYPHSDRLINILEDAIDTDEDWSGVYLNVTKTAGASDYNDDFSGANVKAIYNQSGGEIGYFQGLNFVARQQDGRVGDSGGSNDRTISGIRGYADLEGGTVEGDVAGMNFVLDQAAGHTVTSDLIGCRIRVDADGTNGRAIMLQLVEQSGIDWGIHQSGTAPHQIRGDIYMDSDTASVVFGAGQDAKIYYDGTDLCINTKVTGSGTIKINGVGAWNGTFTNGDGDTVTVTDGIITNVV